MRAHELVRVFAADLRDNLGFKAFEQVKTLVQKRIALYAAAVVLHSFGDGHVEFAPIHAVFAADGGEQAFTLGCGFRFIIVGQGIECFGSCGGFAAGVVARSAGETGAVRSVELVAGGVDAVDVCFEVPIVPNAARRAEQLPFLFEKVCGLPACAVALQHVLFGVKSALRVIFEDRNFCFALFADHHAPDDAALRVGHTAEVCVERQLVAAAHELFKIERFGAAVLVLRVINDAAL